MHSIIILTEPGTYIIINEPEEEKLVAELGRPTCLQLSQLTAPMLAGSHTKAASDLEAFCSAITAEATALIYLLTDRGNNRALLCHQFRIRDLQNQRIVLQQTMRKCQY